MRHKTCLGKLAEKYQKDKLTNLLFILQLLKVKTPTMFWTLKLGGNMAKDW